MSFWQEIRKDFPIVKKYLYFDHAAGGPVPRPVQEAAEKYYREHSEEADFAWMKWIRRRDEAREKAAKFIGADPFEIAFISSTSQGMNFIAEMLADQGTVLTTNQEFPSSTVPWIWRKSKIIWQEPKQNQYSIDATAKKISPKVATVLTSFVQYSTGFRQDLEALGKIKQNRFLVVNATQGFGAFPINVEKSNIDFLVTNSYKWLLAGYGGGILYIRKKWLKKFHPKTVGWRSMVEPEARMDNRSTELHPNALRYELGCPSFPAIFSVGAAIDYLSDIGMEKVAGRILELTDFLIAGLQKLNLEIVSPIQSKSQRSGIVVFKMENAKTLWMKLMAEGICVSPRGAGIRVAPHFYNTEAEIEKFLKILKRLIAR